MTNKRNDGGDCNMIMENPKQDPPLRTSLLVGILMTLVGVLALGIVGVVYSQIQSDRINYAVKIEKQDIKIASLEIKTAESAIAFDYIKEALADLKTTTNKVSNDVEQLKKQADKK